jgi:hypothetical protein
VRIYKINIEHVKYGRNMSSEKVLAKTFKEAVRKGEKLLRTVERIESVELIAATD